MEPHWNSQLLAAIVEQLGLLRRPDYMTRKFARLDASTLVELAKMRYDLLDHTPAEAHAAHQAPIAVDLSVLFANRMAQVHASSEQASSKRKYPRSSLHLQIRVARSLTL